MRLEKGLFKKREHARYDTVDFVDTYNPDYLKTRSINIYFIQKHLKNMMDDRIEHHVERGDVSEILANTRQK